MKEKTQETGSNFPVEHFKMRDLVVAGDEASFSHCRHDGLSHGWDCSIVRIYFLEEFLNTKVNSLCSPRARRTIHCNTLASVASVSGEECTFFHARPTPTQRQRSKNATSGIVDSTIFNTVSAISHESAGEYVDKNLLGNFRTWAEPEVSEKRPLRALLTKVSSGGREGD